MVMWHIACVVVASVVALEPVRPRVVATKRAVLASGGAAALARCVAPFAAVGADADGAIDMEKIRALSAKTRAGLNPAPPKDRDPRDRALQRPTTGSIWGAKTRAKTTRNRSRRCW